MNSLETRVTAIKSRNKRVELDKAWETSWTRRLTIAGFTYLIAVTYLEVINTPSPWLSSVVPVIGYLLSTLVLPWVRVRWQRK